MSKTPHIQYLCGFARSGNLFYYSQNFWFCIYSNNLDLSFVQEYPKTGRKDFSNHSMILVLIVMKSQTLPHFIAVDRDQLVSVSVVFIEDDSVLSRVCIQGIGTEQFIVFVVFISGYFIASFDFFAVIVAVVGVGNVLTACLCLFCNPSYPSHRHRFFLLLTVS